jgi:hypothetical protein
MLGVDSIRLRGLLEEKSKAAGCRQKKWAMVTLPTAVCAF